MLTQGPLAIGRSWLTEPDALMPRFMNERSSLVTSACGSLLKQKVLGGKPPAAANERLGKQSVTKSM